MVLYVFFRFVRFGGNEQTVCQRFFSDILSVRPANPPVGGMRRTASGGPRPATKRGGPFAGRLFVGYRAYSRNFMLHLPPGGIDRKPAAAGSGAFGALVIHDCGSGQQ